MVLQSNVRGCNGGVDFDQEMLDQIFNKIHTDEIVLLEEQTGVMRDEWIWNEIQSRSRSPQGIYLRNVHFLIHLILSEQI